MCEFQIVKPNGLPMCEYTNDICTYCVCGNSNTYNEAIKRSDNNERKTST